MTGGLCADQCAVKAVWHGAVACDLPSSFEISTALAEMYKQPSATWLVCILLALLYATRSNAALRHWQAPYAPPTRCLPRALQFGLHANLAGARQRQHLAHQPLAPRLTFVVLLVACARISSTINRV